MGVHKTNVPARFDGETLSRIDAECALHKMNRSQYIRESMIKWLRLRMAGTVQLLDAFVQQEQREICAPREHGEQSLQIEFPVIETGLTKKPPVRIGVEARSRRGQESASRRTVTSRVAVASVATVAWFPLFPGKVSPIKSTSYGVTRRVA